MPRAPREYRATHQAADSFEPRLARAVLKAAERMRANVSIYALAMALERTRYNRMQRGRTDPKDVDAALELLTVGVKDALAPAGTIARDACLKGGRVGAEMVNRAVR